MDPRSDRAAEPGLAADPARPQRLIRKGAWVVDGWAEANGYTVFFGVGNLGLREMVEAVRDDPDTRVLLVDRSREDATTPSSIPTWTHSRSVVTRYRSAARFSAGADGATRAGPTWSIPATSLV